VSENKNFKLAFIGQNTLNHNLDFKKNVLEIVTTNNLQNNVYFLDFDEKIEDFYTAIDVTLMASDAESVGMVTLESMFLNKPVLGSNAAGTKEIIEQSQFGFTFESKNKHDLASKFNDLGQNMLNLNYEKKNQYLLKFEPQQVFDKLFSIISKTK
jgi:glycosyltransferase involved in cell wall biosynthesis